MSLANEVLYLLLLILALNDVVLNYGIKYSHLNGSLYIELSCTKVYILQKMFLVRQLIVVWKFFLWERYVLGYYYMQLRHFVFVLCLQLAFLQL